ncbi:MAG: hypothetical protein R6U96_09635 [Promethearchaeia archaeon]
MTRKEEQRDKEDYHGVAPISHIVKRMKKEYDKDPKNWRVVGFKDEKGNDDTFITKKPNTYWLKSKQLSPFSSLSMGSVVRNIDRDIDEEIGNKMSKKDMIRLFGMAVPVKKDKNIIASGIEKYSETHGGHIRKIINERKPNVGPQLTKRIEEKFTRKHPQRKNLYL